MGVRIADNMMTLWPILSLLNVVVFTKKYRKDLLKFRDFPLRTSCFFLVLSFILSSIYSYELHIPNMIIQITVYVFSIFSFWVILLKKPYLARFFIKCTFLFGAIVGLYSFYETAISANPILDLFNSIGIYSEGLVVEAIRFGIKRSQSIFLMHTTNGAVALISFGCLFYLYQSSASFRDPKHIGLLCLFFIIPLLSGSRSTMIGTYIIVLMVLFVKNKIRLIVSLFFIFFIILVLCGDLVNEIILSMTDTSSLGGSDSSMRTEQLLVSYDVMNTSPLLGKGLGYSANLIKDGVYDELFGAESIWFPVMMDQGILGIASYALFFFQILKFSWDFDRKLILFPLALLISFTLSSLPNILFTYIFCSVYALKIIINTPKRLIL